jgi:hypothetical protein
MEDSAMADGASSLHRERIARIGVEHAIVLDIAALANVDPLFVATQNRAIPDIGAVTEADAADELGIGRGPYALRQDRILTFER